MEHPSVALLPCLPLIWKTKKGSNWKEKGKETELLPPSVAEESLRELPSWKIKWKYWEMGNSWSKFIAHAMHSKVQTVVQCWARVQDPKTDPHQPLIWSNVVIRFEHMTARCKQYSEYFFQANYIKMAHLLYNNSPSRTSCSGWRRRERAPPCGRHIFVDASHVTTSYCFLDESRVTAVFLSTFSPAPSPFRVTRDTFFSS